MIKKNGSNKWEFDLGGMLQVVIILGGMLAFYLGVNEKVDDAITELRIVTTSHEVRIEHNEKNISDLKAGR